jgi:ATP-dependent Clp protease ATP-binding subunit ClpA
MLVGLLRLNNGMFVDFFHGTGTDVAKLQAMIGERLLPDSDPLTGQELPADALAEAALQVAVAEADSRRRSSVGPIHLMAGIVSQETGPAAQVLREAGLTVAQMSDRLTSAC